MRLPHSLHKGSGTKKWTERLLRPLSRKEARKRHPVSIKKPPAHVAPAFRANGMRERTHLELLENPGEFPGGLRKAAAGVLVGRRTRAATIVAIQFPE